MIGLALEPFDPCAASSIAIFAIVLAFALVVYHVDREDDEDEEEEQEREDGWAP